jgi:sulfite reductase (NADPH) flavoprotein alpha-component
MAETPSSPPVVYNRKNPFPAKLTVNRKLTRPGSGKDTRHFVIDFAGSGLTYTPGDSVAVYSRNPPGLVNELIETLGFDPATPVKDPRGEATTLRETLSTDYIINRSLKKIMSVLVDHVPQGEQRNKLMLLHEDDNALNEYIFTRDYVDIFRDFYEAKFDAPEEFLEHLGKMVPRLYSIASSQALFPNELHMIIAIVRYKTHGRNKTGMCSGFLADTAELNVNNIPVFMVASKSFRLPEDRNRDIIMVGPGTGIAPFRAFLQQRALDGATGRNWLFFGEQHRATEFYYEEEWAEFAKKGMLHRFDTAFSRDQDNKIYVQDRMREHGADLWKWLQDGAYFYVCGDAKRMAKDVHQTLIDIARSEGGMSADAAADYVNVTLMKTEKRYLRDVY